VHGVCLKTAPLPLSVPSKTLLEFVMEYVLRLCVRNLVAYKTIIIPPLPRRTIQWKNVKYIEAKKIVGVAGDVLSYFSYFRTGVIRSSL
jgi:hypothetical protein